ncbi:MAG: peptidyl-prolyl cis-trans isomerase [Candidatus Omnitrophica bacterium]|nr:peptidyl-prolyl cis-trans isomerase [Candidatus Omnitrophota bacterium]
MKKWVFIIGVILMASFVVGCDQIEKFLSPKVEVKPPVPKSQAIVEEAPQGTKLAKVNNKIITYEEFEQNIKNLLALSEEIQIESFDEKKNLLDEMINQELLYQEAKSRGIHTRKEIQDLTKGYLRGLAVRQLIIDITENVTVDAQEIETFYNQYKDQLTEPEQRRVREIVVSSEYRAKDILINLLSGEDFATIAKEKSIGESSINAGDIGLITYGQRGEDYKKYDEIAFSIDAGEISSIFKGPKGYYILKIEEIQQAKAKSLTDLWDQVKNNLLALKQQQRLQDLVDKLKGDAEIEIVEELLK